MIWEISNPFDPYTIETDSFQAALAAVLIVGQGRYGLNPLDGGPKMFPVLFGDLPDETYAAANVKSAEELMAWMNAAAENNEAVAAALDGVRIGRDRLSPLQSKTDHDSHRSSISDIARFAWKYAEALRGKRMFSSIDAENPATV